MNSFHRGLRPRRDERQEKYKDAAPNTDFQTTKASTDANGRWIYPCVPPQYKGPPRPPEGRGIRSLGDGDDSTARTSTVERVPDLDNFALDAIWEREWRENLLCAALTRVKQTVNPAHYEMYHMHVVQGLTPRETARALGVSTAAVHVAKHRVGRLLRRQIKKLEGERS